MGLVFELTIIVVLCGLVNSLLGTFLVIRETSLISFGLAHSVLLGIVIAFLITNSLTSPLLMVGAAIMGLIIVSLIEILNQSRFVKYDAALGLTYLSVFALGILALTRFAQGTTLTLNSVISGQILFTPFIRTQFLRIDLPTVIWLFIGLLLTNIAFIYLFYKELILTSFDPGFAKTIGIHPSHINYLLMALVSLTIVGSFSVVGAILVLAFMIVPGATASLYSKNIPKILLLTAFLSIFGASVGIWLAITFNLSISGTISTIYGLVFIFAMLVSPQGLIQQFRLRNKDLSPPISFLVEHGGE